MHSIKKHFTSIALLVIPLIAFSFIGIFSHIAIAATQVCPEEGGTTTNSLGDTVICFQNPLGGSNGIGGVTDLMSFVQKVLDVILTIGVPIVALAIIYCGFLFVFAQGDPTKIKAAREAFLWTIVGAAILLGSWVLAQALNGTIKEILNAV